LLLCSRLVEGYASSSRVIERARGGLAPWQKRRAEEILMNHLSGNLKLDRLARECNLSPGHFARAFKTSFGVSVHQWVLDRRIEHSKVLMSHSSLGLLDVAFRTGFSSQSTFTRAFQQRVGVSPGHWRRNVGPSTSPSFAVSERR
jgi:AraC family transcriptional regulator